jgi:putative iron-dependent peroxidase
MVAPICQHTLQRFAQKIGWHPARRHRRKTRRAFRVGDDAQGVKKLADPGGAANRSGGDMSEAQPGILGPCPRLARYLILSLANADAAKNALRSLAEVADGEKTVVGLGQPLLLGLGGCVGGLRAFPAYAGAGFTVPSTPAALWCWLRGDDRGELYHRSRAIQRAVAPAFNLETVIDAFQYGESRDLTGYQDGTENPKGKKATGAAIVQGQGDGMDGSSYVAVQQWVHDFDKFDAMPARDQDNSIGRRKSDNEELTEAPASAHVKRTAQETFAPQAFVLRRSMPWADGARAGLVFVAFGKSLDAFEAQLKRMVGAEDGITDALFRFTRPVSGSYFWCPPVKKGRLDLRAAGV